MIQSDKKPRVGVGVLLLKEGKMLLGLRHVTYKKAGEAVNGDGTWTMPGGKLEFGETLEECAVRETFEETGIQINKNDLELISVHNDMDYGVHFVTLGFFCDRFIGEPHVAEPDKITDWQWFPINALPHPLFSPSKHIFDNYVKKRVY